MPRATMLMDGLPQWRPPMAALVLLALGTVKVAAWNNGEALTPPMGFANWNLFGCGTLLEHAWVSFWTVWQLEGAELYPWPCVLRRADYDDGTFRSMADALVSTGLKDAGYVYMLVQVRGLCVHCCIHSHRGASLCEGLWCSAASTGTPPLVFVPVVRVSLHRSALCPRVAAIP
jgi:hypothetical protein